MTSRKSEYKRLSGGKPEHIEIAEKTIKRKLGKHEQVHHRDGDKTNNDPLNLMVMRSASDHSKIHGNVPIELFQTKDGSYVAIKEQITCLHCERLFEPNNSRSKFCSMECYLVYKAKNIPSYDDLKQLIWSKPITKLADEIGVSDKAIHKWCDKLNIEKPPIGYWLKS